MKIKRKQRQIKKQIKCLVQGHTYGGEQSWDPKRQIQRSLS